MREQPAVVLAAELTRLLDDAGEVPVLSLSAAELASSIEMQLSLIDRLTAQLACLVERAEEADLPAELGAPSMAVWLRARFGLSPRAAAELVRETAGLVAAPIAARAARLGAVRAEAAAEIGHALAALPAEVGPELRAEGADVLLGLAVGRDGPPLDAQQVRRIGEHLHEVLEPELAERLLAARLDREDAEAHRRRYLSITDDPCGGVRLRGLLSDEAGAILRAVIAPLAAPAAATWVNVGNAGGSTAAASTTRSAGTTGSDTTAASAESPEGAPTASTVGTAGTATTAGTPAGASTTGTPAGATTTSTAGRASTEAAAVPSGPPVTGTTGSTAVDVGPVADFTDAQAVPDDRTGGQRRADALVEACERLLRAGALPSSGGERPQLVVTLDHEQLSAAVGAGSLPDGVELSPAAVRRLACDAGVVPAVLGSASQPLDVGRSSRTATPAQRRALALRDGGCAFPGCDRPPAWCDAHHIQHWEHLGQTDLANLVLLCGYHHRVLHHDGWSIRPPADGVRPVFVPPAWVDPRRRGRRNLHHHVDDLLHAPVGRPLLRRPPRNVPDGRPAEVSPAG